MSIALLHKSVRLQLCKISISHEKDFFDLIIDREEKREIRHFRHSEVHTHFRQKAGKGNQADSTAFLHKIRHPKRTISTKGRKKQGITIKSPRILAVTVTVTITVIEDFSKKAGFFRRRSGKSKKREVFLPYYMSPESSCHRDGHSDYHSDGTRTYMYFIIFYKSIYIIYIILIILFFSFGSFLFFSEKSP